MMFAIGDKVWPGISKLVEECGEVLQVAGKMMGTRGEAAHWDGSDLRGRLLEELADLMAAIEFVVEENFSADEAREMLARVERKKATFQRWHLAEDPLPKPP